MLIGGSSTFWPLTTSYSGSSWTVPTATAAGSRVAIAFILDSVCKPMVSAGDRLLPNMILWIWLCSKDVAKGQITYAEVVMYLHVRGVFRANSEFTLQARAKRTDGKSDVEEQQTRLERALADILKIAERIAAPVPEIVDQIGAEKHPGFKRQPIIPNHVLGGIVADAQKSRPRHIEADLTQAGILRR